MRLRQAVLELSLDTMALREELKRTEGGERVAAFGPRIDDGFAPAVRPFRPSAPVS